MKKSTYKLKLNWNWNWPNTNEWNIRGSKSREYIHFCASKTGSTENRPITSRYLPNRKTEM